MEAASPQRLTVKKSPTAPLKWGALLLVAACAAWGGWRWWQHDQAWLSTDDAYLNAHTVEVAAQVAGPVVKVYVQNNQAVKAGDPLFDIDPAPYQIAVDRARAQLALATQGVSQQQAAVAAARAQVAQRQAELDNILTENRRTQALVSDHFMAKSAGDTTSTQVATARAAVAAAQAQLRQAESALGDAGPRNAGVEAATAALNQARLDLAHTRVTATSGGVIANLSLRPGNLVQPGTPLFALIDDQDYWVDANFKETELSRLRPGQKATIEVDMYPRHPFAGTVVSLSGGAGTAFSLLPPQNATGNWVKVTQRVPVRVHVDNPERAYPLRVGTTATVSVRTAP